MILVIEKEKIINYLLKPIEKADKSKFLKLLGYHIENWEQLQYDIINQFGIYNQILYETNNYGTLYKIEGLLKAPLKTATLTTIWIHQKENNYLKLVTLFPKNK
jgi:23S rRNA maturation-related 3'-5' exoribonuclease YhaM